MNIFAIRISNVFFMHTDRRIEDFARLGELLLKASAGIDKPLSDAPRELVMAAKRAGEANAWFTEANIRYMLDALGRSLDADDLERWMAMYGGRKARRQADVAVVMAGNIPAVGFHDFLCVLMAGHRIKAKLSSDDRYLLPAMAGLLREINPEYRDLIEFSDGAVKDFDAVIATGSNNTARYFNYYFGRYPHIIRRNRNGLAVISGGESREELAAIGEDIFTYFGLGCRNVSRLIIPEGYDFSVFFNAIEGYRLVAEHHKYRNNYDYNKSIFLVNGEPHYDNGFLLLKEDAGISSPVSVLYYEKYSSIQDVNEYIEREAINIQCVVSGDKAVDGSIPPGRTQHPRLWDYADGEDTMAFLLGL